MANLLWQSTAPSASTTHQEESVHTSRTAPMISWKAHRRGLHSVEALKVAVLRQQQTWWRGKSFHCPLCNMDFSDPGIAAEHIVMEQHPVLRMDDMQDVA